MRRWIAVLITTLLPALAAAHPLSKDTWSLRSAVQAQADALDVVVVLEVPFAVVTKDLRERMDAVRASGEGSKGAQAVLDAYAKEHWARMAKGLKLTVDGKAVEGSWRPRDNRYNGKGAVDGGFFMYIVEFVPTSGWSLDGDVTVVVENAAYPDEDMVYSGLVLSSPPWTVTRDSSKDVLPDRPYDLRSPDFWLPDASLRKLVARFVKAP